LVGPANGVALAQPITLEWNPIVDPDGPIGRYTWQVGTSSTFGTVIAEGSQNLPSEEIPLPTLTTTRTSRELLAQGVSRSDYMFVEDPLLASLAARHAQPR
jgi:hypothetical protein